MYAGALGPTGLHAHHAWQVVAGEGVSLAGADGVAATAPAFVVPPDTPHAIAAPAPAAVMLFVDPDGPDGRRLRRVASSAPDATSWVSPLPPPAPPETWAEARDVAASLWTQLVGAEVRPRPQPPAITRVLRAIDARPDDVGLDALAAVAGLSKSRLSHLFSAEVGIPVRSYLRWARMMRAAGHIARGASLTEAAHAAGFTDSAHLNRTFRDTIGLAPSDVTGLVEWVLPPA
jgi:AraC-like DNA-binding protein